MRIGIISNHHFAFLSINQLLNNKILASLAVPDIQSQHNQNVKMISDSFQIPFKILTKSNLENDLKDWLNEINADVVFIFAFPYKIPESVLKIPQYGFINFHPSILPAYRGPDPLFWQIKNGEKVTGVTAHKMNKNIDAGSVIHIEKETDISQLTYGYLENKFAITLLKCVTKVLAIIDATGIKDILLTEQDENVSTYFKRPADTDLIIDWKSQTAEAVSNLILAANPKYMGAITFYKNVPLRIIEATILDGNDSIVPPGTIVDIENGIKIYTMDNKILSLDIIYVMEGCYTGKAFQRLFNINSGEKLGLQT